MSLKAFLKAKKYWVTGSVLSVSTVSTASCLLTSGNSTSNEVDKKRRESRDLLSKAVRAGSVELEESILFNYYDPLTSIEKHKEAIFNNFKEVQKKRVNIGEATEDVEAKNHLLRYSEALSTVIKENLYGKLNSCSISEDLDNCTVTWGRIPERWETDHHLRNVEAHAHLLSMVFHGDALNDHLQDFKIEKLDDIEESKRTDGISLAIEAVKFTPKFTKTFYLSYQQAIEQVKAQVSAIKNLKDKIVAWNEKSIQDKDEKLRAPIKGYTSDLSRLLEEGNKHVTWETDKETIASITTGIYRETISMYQHTKKMKEILAPLMKKD